MPHKEEKLEENVFHYSDEINFRVEEKIHEKWKANNNNMMLSHFNEQKTDAQIRASCLDEVIEYQWEKYVDILSENGKISRKRLVVPHHGGTKSFVNHAIEKTYRAKDGKTPNPVAEENRTQMEALKREDLEENGSDNDVLILEVTSYDQMKGDKYSKIMGAEKPGRIRGVGSKVREDQVGMQNDMKEEGLKMDKTVDEMKKANEESQEKIDALLLLLSGRSVLPNPEPWNYDLTTRIQGNVFCFISTNDCA
ncbi:hypothetical protein MKW98_017613 [Papaver atlanticum]|uniref:Uncharacterized protein n=1 Tax=Papaver atlanticum TaxID=357466 RepID=A0AAD4TBB9_9MAGN|nr:hypothetical protein MKW98_017613 [Papaver atlanticum]